MSKLELVVNRLKTTAHATSGKLSGAIDQTVYTLEDTYRAEKVYGETRIPAGRYKLSLNNWGKAVQYNARYADINHRGMIAANGVKNYTGVLIHTGNTKADTLGCLLIGLSQGVDSIGRSRDAYRLVYPVVAKAIEEGEAWLTIIDHK